MTLFLAQTSSAFDRADQILGSRLGMSSGITVSVEGLGTAKGRYEFAKPNLQRLRLTNADFDEEFLQSAEASVHFDHRAWEYTWYSAFDKLEEAPPEAGPLIRLGAPALLMGRGLTIAPKDQWAVKGKATVNGKQSEVLALKPRQPGGPEAVTLWIDSFGDVLKFRTLVEVDSRSIAVNVEFSDPSNRAPEKVAFSPKVPWGYTPSRLVSLTQPHFTLDEIELGAATLWPSGKSIVLTGKVVLLLTSNDLTDQSDLSRWRVLADRSKAEGARFVHVWIGSEPKASDAQWDTVWDKTGEWERKLGPPVTPYVMVFNGTTFVSAWQGLVPDEPEEMLTPLFKPFKSD